MKPKYRRFLRAAFPSLIILPAMAQLASAVVIMPTEFGDVLVTAGNSGANSILVPAAQPPAFSPFEIRLDPGASLTPAGATAIDIQDPAATYAINMGAGSSIDGGANDGINSIAANLTVNVDGTITGANAISGGPAGIITVVNDSTIIGTAGAGINSTGTVNLTNNFGRSVTGSTNGVVATGALSTIDNFGIITGQAGDGVTVGDGAIVTNSTTFSAFAPFGPIGGGQIAGSNNGVVAGNGLVLENQNLSNITGTAVNGITAGSNANITNKTGGTITGGVNAISIADGTVTNSGLITGPTALLGGAGDSTFNLNLGSVVLGNIDGVAGNDVIAFGPSLSSAGGIDNYISGNITNIDSITKTGGGVALIGIPARGSVNANLPINPITNPATPANPLYTVNANNITVGTGGGLYINGNINAEDGVGQSTFVSNGIAIGGTGTWNANVTINKGGISAGSIPINLDVNPGNSVGTVTITGPVTHSVPLLPTDAPSFIRYDVNPGAAAQVGLVGSGVTPSGGVGGINVSGGTAADLIVQTAGNTYTLNGTPVRIASTNNNAAISNGTYTIVDSAQAIAGAVGSPTVQLNRNVALTDTGFVGSEVQSFLAGGTGAINTGNTVLANNFSRLDVVGTDLLLTVEHNFAGLGGLAPNAVSFGNALDSSINSINAVDQDFIAALDNSDLATVQATLNGLSPDASFGAAVALASGNNRLNALVRDHLALTRAGGDSVRSYVGSYSAKEPAPAPAPQVQNAGMGNVWGTASYAWKDLENDNFGNDFDGEEASFTAGVDYRVSQDFLIGLVLDGSTGDYDYNGGGSDVDSFRAAIYGTYGAPTGIYADFLVGYGTHDFDQRRNAGLLGGINGDTEADSFQASLTVGYAMQSGSVKHGPFGGIEYQNIDVDGYTQGGLLPIAVDGYDVDSLRLLAGYRVEANYGSFMPYASVAYAHELEDDSLNTTATLPGGAGFGVSGAGLESAILISAGANYALTESLTLTGGYHGEIAVGGDGADSHGASLGLNYAF